MNRGKVAFFLPARKGSQRVKNKNTRTFAGIEGGLLANKLRQLIATERIDEIILSTNDEECLRIGREYAAQSSRLKRCLLWITTRAFPKKYSQRRVK